MKRVTELTYTLVLVASLLFFVSVLALSGCSQPPQFEHNERVIIQHKYYAGCRARIIDYRMGLDIYLVEMNCPLGTGALPVHAGKLRKAEFHE